jgi:CRISPR-associated protein Cmr1
VLTAYGEVAAEGIRVPREIPDVPIDWKKPTVDGGRSFDIKLITPMFGVGVETRANAPSFPIRPTAIRGQLQFWWRATDGARYATKQELRAAQSEVWGSTERASRVRVIVEDVRAVTPRPCALFEWDPNARRGQGGWRTNWQAPFDDHDSALPYALFPFQGETPPPDINATINVSPAHCIRTASFRLSLHCPNDLWPQVEPALWAWLNFGGLGGRTRRGCGAIICKQLAPRDHGHFAEQLNQFTSHRTEGREWPTIGEWTLVRKTEPAGDPIQVWDWLMGRFKHFRQGGGFARNPGQQPNRPGRSRYPEPETIRRITGQRSAQHTRISEIPDDAFPRAELGLPIVFHFQGQGEPQDTVLYPSAGPDGEKRERMASPLILKPLALQDGKAIPLILRLKTTSLSGVDLRRGDTSLPGSPSATISAPRLASYRNSPLAGSSNGSALEAFLAYARKEGFTEVTQ